MRFFFCISVLFFSCPSAFAGAGDQGKAYEQQFSAEVAQSKALVNAHFPSWAKQAKSLGLSEKEFAFALAAVFPELTRYYGYQGLAEQAVLALSGDFWLEQDYSIGPFQIKASFVSSLCKKNFRHPEAQSVAGQWKASNPKELKEKLLAPDQAIQVVCLFFLAQKSSQSAPSLELLAMRFNAGMNTPASHCASFAQRRQFPYGPGKAGTQYSYISLSRHFHHSFISHLKTT